LAETACLLARPSIRTSRPFCSSHATHLPQSGAFGGRCMVVGQTPDGSIENPDDGFGGETAAGGLTRSLVDAFG
jgi:hypothetical protein